MELIGLVALIAFNIFVFGIYADMGSYQLESNSTSQSLYTSEPTISYSTVSKKAK
jgi:hypothetical protein